MNLNTEEFESLVGAINANKVSEIVVDALHAILAHSKGANIADMMMAFTVIIRSTLMGMGLSEPQSLNAKSLFDRMWGEVLVNSSRPDHPNDSHLH